jgi:hypothetical protein
VLEDERGLEVRDLGAGGRIEKSAAWWKAAWDTTIGGQVTGSQRERHGR